MTLVPDPDHSSLLKRFIDFSAPEIVAFSGVFDRSPLTAALHSRPTASKSLLRP